MNGFTILCLYCRQKHKQFQFIRLGCLQCIEARRRAHRSLPLPRGSCPSMRFDTNETLIAGSMAKLGRIGYVPGNTLLGWKLDPAALPSSCPLSCAEDPYQLEPTGTLLFLETFFAHSPSELGAVFSCRQVTDWVKQSADKTEDECDSLYAILCLCSVDPPPELAHFARVCQQRAGSCIRRAVSLLSMPIAQARICFAAYCLLHDEYDQARALANSTLTIISSLLSCDDESSGNTGRSTGRNFDLTHGQLRICCGKLHQATIIMVQKLAADPQTPPDSR